MSVIALAKRQRAPAHTFKPSAKICAAVLGLLALQGVHAQTVPIGPTTAASTGVFGPVVNWPIVPIHAAVLADGRVMTYGTDKAGVQGAKLFYEVWDPTLGTGTNAHLVLDNKTGTNIFCSAQVLMQDGTLLIAGGDRTVGSQFNLSDNAITGFVAAWNWLFNPVTDTPMKLKAARWYPSMLSLANGESLVIGGRYDSSFPSPQPITTATPEVFNPDTGWRTLTSATSDAAYGANNWTYPRAWQAPNGKVFILAAGGATFYLNAASTGTLTTAPTTGVAVLPGHPYLPSVMYSPGKILALRSTAKAQLIDLTGATPVVSNLAAGVDQDRYNGFATVMADGKVLVNGGSSQLYTNQTSITGMGVSYQAKIWNPATSAWSTAATAQKVRIYHSISVLLPDGSVLTGGGGAPGPQLNLNAEIYYPPYLYKNDGSGQPAVRPVITQVPQALHWGQSFSLTTDSPITRVTLVRLGSVTHTVNFDQRFIELPLVAGSGNTRTVTGPTNANNVPPGPYMLFAFNAAGVPSKAGTVLVTQ